MKITKEKLNEEKKKILDEALKELERNKFKVVKVKKDILPDDFPEDVTELSDKELGKLYGIYESMAGYVNYVLTLKEIEIDFLKKTLEYKESELMLESKADKLKDKKAEIRLNKDYRSILKEVLRLESKIKLLTSVYEMYERYGKILSREISRRQLPSVKDSIVLEPSEEVFSNDLDYKKVRKYLRK